MSLLKKNECTYVIFPLATMGISEKQIIAYLKPNALLTLLLKQNSASVHVLIDY